MLNNCFFELWIQKKHLRSAYKWRKLNKRILEIRREAYVPRIYAQRKSKRKILELKLTIPKIEGDIFITNSKNVVVLLQKRAIILDTIICFICRGSLSIVHVIWSQQLNFKLSSTRWMNQTEIPFLSRTFDFEENWMEIVWLLSTVSFSFKKPVWFSIQKFNLLKSVKSIIKCLYHYRWI